jgi:hypothetical protein
MASKGYTGRKPNESGPKERLDNKAQIYLTSTKAPETAQNYRRGTLSGVNNTQCGYVAVARLSNLLPYRQTLSLSVSLSLCNFRFQSLKNENQSMADEEERRKMLKEVWEIIREQKEEEEAKKMKEDEEAKKDSTFDRAEDIPHYPGLDGNVLYIRISL